MRRAWIILALLTSALRAQNVSVTEQSYGPYQAPQVGSSPALASSRTGILLAWSEVDASTRYAQVRFGLLDFSGRLVSDLTTVKTPAGRHAFRPLVATDGEAFLVVWAEDIVLRSQASFSVGLRVDSSGRASSEPFVYAAFGPTSLSWNGANYRLLTDGGVVRVGRDGNRLGFGDDAPGGPWEPVASASLKPGSVTCCCQHWPIPYCREIARTLELTWRIGESSQAIQINYQYPATGFFFTQPSITGDGERFLIIWASSRGVEGFVVDAQHILAEILVPGVVALVPPRVAWDGANYLLAWSTTADVRGLLVRGTTLERTEFPIATGPRFESVPQITLLRRGRFLVTYASDIPETREHWMAGRVVTTEPSKKRAVR